MTVHSRLVIHFHQQWKNFRGQKDQEEKSDLFPLVLRGTKSNSYRESQNQDLKSWQKGWYLTQSSPSNSTWWVLCWGFLRITLYTLFCIAEEKTCFGYLFHLFRGFELSRCEFHGDDCFCFFVEVFSNKILSVSPDGKLCWRKTAPVENNGRSFSGSYQGQRRSVREQAQLCQAQV